MSYSITQITQAWKKFWSLKFLLKEKVPLAIKRKSCNERNMLGIIMRQSFKCKVEEEDQGDKRKTHHEKTKMELDRALVKIHAQ